MLSVPTRWLCCSLWCVASPDVFWQCCSLSDIPRFFLTYISVSSPRRSAWLYQVSSHRFWMSFSRVSRSLYIVSLVLKIPTNHSSSVSLRTRPPSASLLTMAWRKQAPHADAVGRMHPTWLWTVRICSQAQRCLFPLQPVKRDGHFGQRKSHSLLQLSALGGDGFQGSWTTSLNVGI